MKKISLTIIAKNEGKNISACLNSAIDCIDEIILVDTGSTDNTKQIARECGAKVYDFPWTNSFAEARNFALQQATGDWILVLDADEQLAPGSADLIRKFVEGPPSIGRVNIVSRYLDNDEVRYTQSPISRLFPKGVYYKGNIHEQVVSDLPHRMTDITVYHEGYFQTDKSERNIPLLKMELEKDPENPYLLMQIAREYKNKQDYDKADHFFSASYRHASKQEGFFSKLVVDYIYSLMKLNKLDFCFALIEEEQNRLAHFPDFHFASGMFYMDYILSNLAEHVDKLPRIEASFLRCLQIGERIDQGGIVGTGSFLAAYNLGVYYEVTGQNEKAVHYYKQSSEKGYDKAYARLQMLTKDVSQ